MHPPELWDLLHAGDWAAAHGDCEALQGVARLLAVRLEGGYHGAARAVAALAPLNLEAASLLWGRLAATLRAEAQHQQPPEA